MANITISVQSLLNAATFDSYTKSDAITVGTLKSDIQTLTQVNVDWFDLFYNGTLLDTSKTLAFYSIPNGAILYSGNKIANLSTKQARQEAKLTLAALDRADSNRRSVLDSTELPTLYNGNAVSDNPNVGGLIEGRPWTSPYSEGIWGDTYTGYFNDVPLWYQTATKTGAGIPYLTAITAASIPATTSIELRGYFKPSVTDTYTFYTSSDDASYLWIGDVARTGYTTGNALVNNGGLHGAQERSGSIALSAGVYYPIRIQAGNNAVTGLCLVSWSNSTQAQTGNFSGLIFYKLVYEGFN